MAYNFAPYSEPPDQHRSISSSSRQGSSISPWFAHQPQSYQSGGVPSFNTSAAGGGIGNDEEEQSGLSVWETRFGWRVDMLAAVAYLGGPVTALILLILETSNDYVRFHAYQSALLITPLLFFRLFLSLLSFGPFLKFVFNVVIAVSAIGMAFQAFRDANAGGLARFRLPYIGEIADRWVSEE